MYIYTCDAINSLNVCFYFMGVVGMRQTYCE